MKKNYLRSLAIIVINVLTIWVLKFLWGNKMNPEDIVMWGTLAIVGAIIQTATILLFYKYVDRKPFNTLRLRMNHKDLLFSVLSAVLTVTFIFFYMVNTAKVEGFSAEWNWSVFSTGAFYLLLLLVGFAWFNAALTEEVLFRWYLVTNLRHLSVVKIYLVTSVFFTISHVFKGLNPIYILVLLVTSCSLLYVYLRSGEKLLPVTIAHMMQNLTTGHLIGKSNIAILQFSIEPTMVHLIIVYVIFNALILGLSAFIYPKSNKI